MAAGSLAASAAPGALAAAAQVESFAAENDAVMARMMSDMEVEPTGNADVDFLRSMMPHHQGAIGMAQALLRYGTDEHVRRLAHGIIVEQQQEIEAMKSILARLAEQDTAVNRADHAHAHRR